MSIARIKITRNLKVGALDAETDNALLDQCFVDKGYLDQLKDVANPASIILGRTGSGKSALLYKLQKSVDKSVRLDPNDISIRFLEHSDIIQFFDALDINLDLFYRLLWKHLLTVEFLRLRYDIKNDSDGQGFLSGIIQKFNKDNVRKKAIEYFREWGDKFWLDTDEHLKEITSKLEESTKAVVGAKYSGMAFNLEGANSLTDQQRTEVKQRASQVVSGLQIKKLNEVIDLVSEHSFDDEQKRFYILIDQLDEDWANTETRYRFIRALVEEIKGFRKIGPVKIIAALRKDLLDLVFDSTRGSGFQEEKYESYILEIRWSSEELSELIEKRINAVFRSQYTSGTVTFDNIFPKPRKNGGQKSIDFLLERTLRRPRDVLQFVNECFSIASDRETISWRAMQAAEAQYSIKRLKSLKEEWGDIYPCLETTLELLRGLPASFIRSQIQSRALDELLLPLYEAESRDPCSVIVREYFDGNKGVKEADVIYTLLACLYRVSAIGIKTSSLETFVWSYIDQTTVSKGEIKRAIQIKAHKMLHRSLDVIVSQGEVYGKED